ncbi:MAG: CoA transferase, partial [Caulobacterales bacterium]
MSPIAAALLALSEKIAGLTEQLGRRVKVADLNITDRRGELALAPPGVRSPNGACRLVQASDGWIAVNLARDEDRDLIPAWLEREIAADPWASIIRLARRRACADLLAAACLLGLPVARVGEAVSPTLQPPLIRMGAPAADPRRSPVRVVDLSALWAGPMCGAILAAMGASVVKVESLRRPDPTRTATPPFYARLNGGKAELALDLTAPDGQARLRDEIQAADVLITGARPRAFASLGLVPDAVFGANPSLVWVAITGYGWTGPGALRVAFGDDAAAAGGLVRWTSAGAPRFLGDALADPVTGLMAAVGALKGLTQDGGVLVDAALARCAAGAAA